MTSVSFQNNYRDEIDDVDNYASDGKSFKNKTKIIGKTPARPPPHGSPGGADQLATTSAVLKRRIHYSTQIS